MKKLRLHLDALRVESFSTAALDGRGEGTVQGREAPPSRWQAGCFTAPGAATCTPDYTCPECASPPTGIDDCP